jgi:glycerophosphoryl diester phosphodiesterase
MLLLGHRGCRDKITENTFAAFDHALECGCDGFELDVRLSSDAVPVIWHDARVRSSFISRHNFGSLRERCLTAGRLRRDRRVIELCQLEEVLARYAHVGWMDIELKVRGLEAQVAGLVRRYRPARGFVISSFRRPVLLELHRIDPGLPLGFIFDRMPRAKVWSDLPIQFVKPNVRLVTAARVRQFHAKGKQVLAWTVNHPSTMPQLAEAGVDGMIGDDPVLLAGARGAG